MFSFAYSWIFILLPLPWLVHSLAPARKVSKAALRVPFGDRIREALGNTPLRSEVARSAKSSWVPVVIWLLVLGGLARPQWIEAPITKSIPTRDLLLLVDLSASMQQEDFVSRSGESVDRLTAVKEVLGEFLKKREGDRVGLVVFGDAAYLQAPFSTDLRLVEKLLNECDIGMAGPRTALGDAIGLAVNLFADSQTPAKTIIALTDGNDTKSQVPPVEAARVAAQRDIRIHTVAIGDPTTVGEQKLDEQALRDVASTTGGSYFFAADRQNLEGIYQELDELETRDVKTVSHRPRRELYYFPVAVAFLISLLGKLWSSLFQLAAQPAIERRGTVRVNALTGELEVVE